MKYGIEEAILIGNFQFWIAKNRADKRNMHDGRTWTYNSAAAFAELIPYFSPDKVDRTIKSLVRQGVMLIGNYSDKPTDRTRWFAFVNESEFLPTIKKKECKKLAGKDQLPFRESAESEEMVNSHSAKVRNANRESAGPFRESAESLYRTDITTDVNADNTPQPPSADAPGVRDAGKASEVPSATFVEAWAVYPKRPGNSKAEALRQWNARVKAGASEHDMLAGTKAYAAYCKAMKTEPRYVKLAETFFGRSKHYESDWSVKDVPEQQTFFTEDVRYEDVVQPI